MEQLRRGWVFVLLGIIACGGTVTRQHSDGDGSSDSGAAPSTGGVAGGTVSIPRGGMSATGGNADPGPGGASAGSIAIGGTSTMGTGGTAIGGMAIAGSGGSGGAPSCECIGNDCLPGTLWTEPECGELFLRTQDIWLYALSSKLGTLTRTRLPPEPGAATPIAKGFGGALAFALDGKFAYIAANITLFRVDLATGDQITLLSEATAIRDVTVSGGQVYYTVGKTVKVATTEPPTSGVVVATAQDAGEPQAVAVAGDVLGFSTTAFSVETKSLSGGTQSKLAPSQAALHFGHRALQADASQLFWTNFALFGKLAQEDASFPPRTLAFARWGVGIDAFVIDSASQLAYIATEDGQVEKSTFKDGAAGVEATSLARNVARITSLELDAKHVFAASGCSVLCMRR